MWREEEGKGIVLIVLSFILLYRFIQLRSSAKILERRIRIISELSLDNARLAVRSGGNERRMP